MLWIFLEPHWRWQLLDWYGNEVIGRKIRSINFHAGNFTALYTPGCLQERFDLISYIHEFAFIRDSKVFHRHLFYNSVNSSNNADYVRKAKRPELGEYSQNLRLHLLTPVYNLLLQENMRLEVIGMRGSLDMSELPGIVEK